MKTYNFKWCSFNTFLSQGRIKQLSCQRWLDNVIHYLITKWFWENNPFLYINLTCLVFFLSLHSDEVLDTNLILFYVHWLFFLQHHFFLNCLNNEFCKVLNSFPNVLNFNLVHFPSWLYMWVETRNWKICNLVNFYNML